VIHKDVARVHVSDRHFSAEVGADTVPNVAGTRTPTAEEVGPVALRIRALRKALGMRQADLAAASGGALDRLYVVRLETGKNQAKTDRVRQGLALAFKLTRDEISDYLDERVSLEELLERRSRRLAPGDSSIPLLRNHKRWPELVAEAKRVRPALRDQTFEMLGDSPFVWGPLERLDSTLLADLARDVQEWRDRATEIGVPPSSATAGVASAKKESA